MNSVHREDHELFILRVYLCDGSQPEPRKDCGLTKVKDTILSMKLLGNLGECPIRMKKLKFVFKMPLKVTGPAAMYVSGCRT
jgi:hypothetical protein